MKRDIALRLIEAVKAQKGPLEKYRLHNRATGRSCVLGLLEILSRNSGSAVSAFDWSLTSIEEACRLKEANDRQPKAAVVKLIRELAK